MPPTSYLLPIASITTETPTDRTFTFRIPAEGAQDFAFVPGQFLTITDPEDEATPPRKKAYSISSSPTDVGIVEVTVRAMGSFGERFSQFPAGKTLLVVPPRGRFTLDPAPTGDLILAAGGSGVAPYRGFVRYLRAKGLSPRTTVLYSARVPEDLVFDAEFRRHAREVPWFRYLPTVTRLPADAPWDGARGRVSAELLGSILREPSKTTLFACGPNEFVDAILALAAGAGLPPDHLRKEKWG